jgi:hypothetical protein
MGINNIYSDNSFSIKIINWRNLTMKNRKQFIPGTRQMSSIREDTKNMTKAEIKAKAIDYYYRQFFDKSNICRILGISAYMLNKYLRHEEMNKPGKINNRQNGRSKWLDTVLSVK